VVDPPSEIAWTGTTMGIRAVHVFRFQASAGGTLARSEESWRGCCPACSDLAGYVQVIQGASSLTATSREAATSRSAAWRGRASTLERGSARHSGATRCAPVSGS
jgi:hypothetical protein